MRKYIIPTIISTIVFLIIIRPGVFNLLPYTIHEFLFRNIIDESLFIYTFDSIFSIIIWIIIYKILK
ncbi:hypothetical protein SAMN05443634_11610 [Chishuiella changwenlii]|uniref:Uncharacterized protein n=1 Tax=Chishuiella changwenlii TaxID=1434701 RepID=A0A1M7CXU1_9FLAO|nr:hypothetical protein SAMN05443634_11610 [Chishuiella changwenlii]